MVKYNTIAIYPMALKSLHYDHLPWFVLVFVFYFLLFCLGVCNGIQSLTHARQVFYTELH